MVQNPSGVRVMEFFKGYTQILILFDLLRFFLTVKIFVEEFLFVKFSMDKCYL